MVHLPHLRTEAGSARPSTRWYRPFVADEADPFAALSLIVAPAIMTNACTVLIMSTSNPRWRTGAMWP